MSFVYSILSIHMFENICVILPFFIWYYLEAVGLI